MRRHVGAFDAARDDELEPRAVRLGLLVQEVAAMGTRIGARDREAEPRAARRMLRVSAAAEPFEQLRDEVG